MSNEKNTTHSAEETRQEAKKLAQQILQQKPGRHAVVLALSGDLGAGKTTFLQGFAKGLGISEVVNSPTFVIMKKFAIPSESFKFQVSSFKFFYHFDCYRLNAPEEILLLGFADIVANPHNIVAIEWPEKIDGILPKNAITIELGHEGDDKRGLTINV